MMSDTNHSVLIIEPHGDDAFISASSVLDDQTLQKTLVTLSCRDSKFLGTIYDNLRVEYLDLQDINVYRKSKIPTHVVHRMYLGGEDVFSYVDSSIKKDVEDVYEDTVKDIQDSLRPYLVNPEYDGFYIPLGLDHPYHMATREAVLRELSSHEDSLRKVIFYCDKPYIAKRYVKEVMSTYLTRYFESYMMTTVQLSEDQISKKTDNFLKAYPTEGGMLVWTRDSVLKDPDIFITGGVPRDCSSGIEH